MTLILGAHRARSDGLVYSGSSYLKDSRSLVLNTPPPPSSTCRSCSTTSATRRSRSDLRAVFTAVTAASSQDWVLVPMTSMTRYTLTASSLIPDPGRDVKREVRLPGQRSAVCDHVPTESGRYARDQARRRVTSR